MGLGLLGRGIQDACFIRKKGAKLTITDLKSQLELSHSIEIVNKSEGLHPVNFVLGEHKEVDFVETDFILKGAGVPLDSPLLKLSHQAGISIKMDASWFAELVPEGVIIIGITGTRGKSTTTIMISEILKAAGKKVYTAGNLRGTATLPLLDIVKPGDYVVLELDSWQLQGFRDSGLSPHIAVFTNFMDDHLNYYGNNRQLYFKDKASIYLNQTQKDILIVGESIPELARYYGYPLPNYAQIANNETMPNDWTIRMPGDHNRRNAACALLATKSLGVSNSVARQALKDLHGPEGRLEKMSISGLLCPVYNDNNATTPTATEAGIVALSEKKLVVILGGASKKLSLDSLVNNLKQATNITGLVLIPGSGTDELLPLLKKANISHTLATEFTQAVQLGLTEAIQKQSTLLFSPAFASFGMFANEYDRNDQFISLIKTYARS